MSTTLVQEYHRDFTDDIGDGIANWFKARKDAYKKKQFALKIHSIINRANAQKANGVKLGDPVYVRLYQEAVAVCDSRANDRACDVAVILSEVPALRELESWATYNQASETKSKVITYICLSVVTVIAVGILVGLGVDAFHITTAWFKR